MASNWVDYLINNLFGNFNWEEFYYSFMFFANQNPFDISWYFFWKGGWILFVIIFTKGLYDIWLDARQSKYVKKWEFKLLAIDIPKNNEQTPKAVENIFSALAGTFSGPNLIEKYWEGKVQESFSFEIISIGGHIRFLIRTPKHFRDLIEAAVYSQYPEAEITEVDDYVEYNSEDVDENGKPIPFKDLKFPNKVYNLWGCEFVFVKPYPYPIRTYPDFEHNLSGNFIDPLAELLEIMSRLNSQEQVWLQLVITPQAPGWGEQAKKIVAQLIGKEYKDPAASKFDPVSLVNKPVDGLMSIVNGVLEQAIGISLIGTTDKKKEEDQWRMFKITPGERSLLERVETKISKHVFKVKFRMIYLGAKAVFNKGRGVAGIMGAIQQYNTFDANGFKPGKLTKTAADYLFVDKRINEKQNKILRYYCKRNNSLGEKMSDILWMNPEELASIWHFPVASVKTAEISKISIKKSPPPTKLPYNQRVEPAIFDKQEKEKNQIKQNIPIQPLFPNQSIFNQTDNQEKFGNQPINFVGARIITEPTKPIIEKKPPTRIDNNSQPVNNNQPVNFRKGSPPPNLPFV